MGHHKSMADKVRAKGRKGGDGFNFDTLDDLFDDIEEMAIDRLQSLRDRLKTSASHFRWPGLGHSAQEELEMATDKTSRYVQNHPWQVLGVAVLLVLAVSSLKSRS